MNAVLDERAQVTTAESMSARVYADARQSFAAKIDSGTLQEQVDEVVALLWTDSPRVTAFIPLLALRELRARLGNDLDVRQE